MLRETIIEADKLLNKFDLETVVVYPTEENHCCISCKTNDDIVYVYTENKKSGYDTQMFGLRNWSSMHSIISSFYNADDDTSMKMKIESDTDNYPVLIKISSGRLKMTYFLQNYSFVSNQSDLKESFEKRKFRLGKNIESNCDNLDESIVKDICKLSALTNEKYFRIGHNENGNYIYFGDENQSVDNGKIDIEDIGGINNWKDDMYFSVEYFSAMYRSLTDCNLMVKFAPTQIIMIGENDNVVKVGAIRGKAL